MRFAKPTALLCGAFLVLAAAPANAATNLNSSRSNIKAAPKAAASRSGPAARARRTIVKSKSNIRNN